MNYSVCPSVVSHIKMIQMNMEKAIPVDIPFICTPEIGPNWAYTEKMIERNFVDREEEED